MALLDLWKSDRQQILEKRIRQLISFAGEGRLLDGNDTSSEFRALLQAVPSELLARWIDDILQETFDDAGFALQDVVNEIGRRLGFVVECGVYRGRRNGVNYDGLWRSPEGRGLVVECKSSTAYQIDVSKIAHYREQVTGGADAGDEELAALLVVGRTDTEAVEAQIRGSRYAWNVRLIGIDALIRLMKLKEALNDLSVERQIRNILFPQEFTRLDRIIDLVFETTEDVQEEGEDDTEPVATIVLPGRKSCGEDGRDDSQPVATEAPKKRSARFYAEILPRLERYVGHPLVKRSRVIWVTPGGETLVSCQVAAERPEGPYWFGFKPKRVAILGQHEGSLAAFGLGAADRVVVLPFKSLQERLPGFFTSLDENGEILHWHVKFIRDGEQYFLLTNGERERVEVTQFLLKD